MNRNTLLAVAAIVIVAVGAGAYWMTTSGSPETPEIVTEADAEAPPEASSDLPQVVEMTLGNPDADVTVIEYASFTCPHCRNFHASVFDQLKANYIDTGKINFIYREVYFDKFGLWAGLVARCAGPVRYFGMVDLIYERQDEWLATRQEAGIAADLRKLGLSAGLEQEQLEACLQDGPKAEALVAEYQKNQIADDVTSTPTFIINGKKHSNMNYADFSAILDGELGE